MFQTLTKLFDKKERLKRKAFTSEAEVMTILNMLQRCSNHFRAEDAPRGKWYGFDYVIADNRFCNQKDFLAFFIEDETVYTAIIKRTSNFATSDTDTVLYYNIGSLVYCFSKEHALYSLFEEIEQKLLGLKNWEDKNNEMMRCLKRDINDLEYDIHQGMRAKKESLRKMNDMQLTIENAKEKDCPYYESLLENLRKEGEENFLSIRKNEQARKEKQSTLEALEAEKERLFPS